MTVAIFILSKSKFRLNNSPVFPVVILWRWETGSSYPGRAVQRIIIRGDRAAAGFFSCCAGRVFRLYRFLRFYRLYRLYRFGRFLRRGRGELSLPGFLRLQDFRGDDFFLTAAAVAVFIVFVVVRGRVSPQTPRVLLRSDNGHRSLSGPAWRTATARRRGLQRQFLQIHFLGSESLRRASIVSS